MPASEQSIRVANAFEKYKRSDDRSLIEGFSREQIEFAITQYTNHHDSKAGFYQAMQMRVEELTKEEERRRGQKEKWIDRAIGIVIGVVITLIANAIWQNWTK